MKKVRYRGGVVTFDLPDDWHEEVDEDDEAGLFYEDTEDAGLMRLYITTASNPGSVTTEVLTGLLDTLTTSKTKTIETLPNGNALLTYITRQRTEQGALHVIFFWIVGNPLPPDHARIANFSYTVLAANAVGFATQRTIALLDKSIRVAVFAPTLDIAGSASAQALNAETSSENHRQ